MFIWRRRGFATSARKDLNVFLCQQLVILFGLYVIFMFFNTKGCLQLNLHIPNFLSFKIGKLIRRASH